MKAKDLKGIAIVSLDAAAQLGRVEDLFFDTTQLRVAALEMSESGQRAIIPFSEVHAIGRDAVTVSSSQLMLIRAVAIWWAWWVAGHYGLDPWVLRPIGTPGQLGTLLRDEPRRPTPVPRPV